MRLVIPLVSVLISVQALSGQAPAGQAPADIDAMRAAVAQDSSVSALRQREFALGRGTAAKEADALLQRGVVLLRLYELTLDDDDTKKARDVFDRASKSAPRDARGFYGLGLAFSVGPGVRIPSPGGVLNGVVIGQSMAEIFKRDPASRAKSAFRKALELDPNLAGAALGLAQLSLQSRDRNNLNAAAQALRQIAQSGRGGSDVAIALSRVEEALGNVEAAAAAAMSAPDDEVGAAALHAQAVALLRQPAQIEAGARAYFQGVAALTAESAETFYQAVRPIMTERERTDWQNSGLEFRKEWLKRFWDVRAAGAGVTAAERMAEHFERLALAQERYRRIGKRGAAPGGSLVEATYKDDKLPFDDRGLILVRHGEPDEIVRTAGVDLRPNETWVYRVNGRNQLFNFILLRDGSDFRLVDDVLFALDPSTQGTPIDDAIKLLTDRTAYEPRYAAMVTRFESYRNNRWLAGAMASLGQNVGSSAGQASESLVGLGETRTRIAQENRQVALAALQTDSDAPDFTAELPFYYDLYTFKGAQGFTDVTAAVAIPGTSLQAQPLANQFIYSLQTSLILIDTITSQIARRDTIYTFRSPRILSEDEHLRLHIDLTAPYSPSSVHRIVLRDLVQAGAGQLYGGEAVLRDFSSLRLMISDIVLAEPENGTWQRGEARLALVPPRQFAERRPLRLFYELYNLAANTPYRTEITMTPAQGLTGFGRIKKLFGGSGGTVKLQFDGVASPDGRGVIQELKEVTAEVKPGKYRVVVRVVDLQNQQSVRNETVFVVLDSK